LKLELLKSKCFSFLFERISFRLDSIGVVVIRLGCSPIAQGLCIFRGFAPARLGRAVLAILYIAVNLILEILFIILKLILIVPQDFFIGGLQKLFCKISLALAL
jgi:hypothetical protein